MTEPTGKGSIEAAPRPRILVVDDEPENLALLLRTLRADFETIAASSGDEARRLLESPEGTQVEVVVTDQRMPGLTGLELLAWVAQRLPRMGRLIVTAYADVQAMLQAINQIHVDRFLLKPWRPAELLAAIHDLLERRRESPEALAEENARARIRQEQLEEQYDVLRRRAAALERAMEQTDRPSHELDLLTGLPSAAVLKDRLAAAASAEGGKLAVLVADVDDLDVLNASRGTEAGDAAIIDLGDALAAELGPGAFVARLGGGRFLACLPGSTKPDALALAERAAQRYGTVTPGQTARAHHTTSIGVASLPDDAGTIDELLMKADVALCSAKAAGKNRAVAY